jgi:PAS domain S-box-containing protein
MTASRYKKIIITSLFLVLCSAFLLPGLATSQPETVEVKIGVLAKRGTSLCIKKWSPTTAYLSAHIPGYSFTLVPLGFGEIIPAVSRQEIDFILSNPAIFAGLEVTHGTNCVATMVNLLQQQQSTEFGGVIFYKAGRKDIRSLTDLKGKSFMAVDRQSFGGWLTALEQLKTQAIEPDHDFRALQFAGTHDAVVYAVLAGKVDAGTVRTDTLERMALENKISLTDLEVIPFSHNNDSHSHTDLIHHTVYEQFPNLYSTHLYPEWPFAKLNHTPLALAEEVAKTLYNMEATSEAAQAAHIAGWTIPQQYQSVRECLQELRIWPYEDLGKIYLKDVFKKYWLFLLGAALLLCTSLLVSLYIVRLNRALNLSQQELQNSLNRQATSFDQIIEESLNEIYIFDATSLQFLRVNKGAQKNLGYDAIELGLMTPMDIKPELSTETFLAMMQPLIAGQDERLIFETVHQRKDGSTYPVEVHLQPSSYHGRKVYVAMIIDISERKTAEAEKKKLEENLQQAQKMEAIGTLAGGIAHDFNNILSVILGFTELSQLQIGANDPISDDLNQIGLAATRAAELVKQILTFSRKAEHELLPLQPHLIVKEALKMLRSSLPTTVELEEHIDSHCGMILADATNIHQIVVNLCTNAFHALDNEKGTIAVKLSCREIGTGEITEVGVAPGPFVELAVTDTGHGIDKETLGKIFDPYFTTKEAGKGTGLGLAVIYGIVKECQGFIQVDSAPGQGTTFHIYLPILDGERELPAKTEAEESLTTGSERILVVDDEPHMITLCTSMLERLGYVVTGTTDSLEALALFQAAPQGFDLLISDQTMPRMTGSELAREIRKIRPDMAIIICSGYSSVFNKEEAQAMGIKSYLKKPITYKQLAGTVREVLDNV